MSQEQNISQAEVWDDSALIESWNDALAEYKKYHSVHVKGGSVADVQDSLQLKSKQASQLEQTTAETNEQEGAPSAESEAEAAVHVDGQSQASMSGRPVPPGLSPQAVLGSVGDENLKKLLMSWYYAGYYTGLFEGQQQAKPQT